MQKLNKITIIGLGVMGGSLGLALKRRRPEIRVLGVDINTDIIQEAISQGAIDDGTTDIAAGVREADLIFLATPMPVIEKICYAMAPHLQEGAIVTDLGSTKVNIVRIMANTLPTQVRFLGGHPMTGSEKTGFRGASEILFENAAYILTPLSDSDEEVTLILRGLVESLGAWTIILTPEDHDRKVAAVSHLPHVVASALVNAVGSLEAREGGYFSLAAGGFRDSTRIAASNSEMWTDILLQNSQALLPLIRGYKQCLQEFERALEKENAGALYQLFNRAKQQREKVPTGMKGILPQLFELAVLVPDKPGVIGELAILLGSKQINISDIEIMRVREEDDSTLRLGFGQENHREQALQVLVENGFIARKSGL